MASLTGNEQIVSVGTDSTGRLAGVSEIITPQQIAALSGQMGNSAIATLSTVGAGTITAAAMVGRIVSRTGTQVAGFVDTTDTGPNIIAAMGGGAVVGSSLRMIYINNTAGGFTATLAANATGVTLTGTATVPQNTWAEYLVSVATATTVTVTFVDGGALPGGTAVNQVLGALATTNFSVASTVLANITGLAFPVQAGATYGVDGFLHGSSQAATGVVLIFSAGGSTISSANLVVQVYNGTTTILNNNVTSFTTNLVAATTAYTDVIINGSFTVGATGGTVQLQGGQNVSQTTATTVAIGSAIAFARLA